MLSAAETLRGQGTNHFGRTAKLSLAEMHFGLPHHNHFTAISVESNPTY